MTHFLISEEKPDGYKLEEILKVIRRDILSRSTKIMDDDRAEAQRVLDNSVEILSLITKAIHLAEGSSSILEKSFGPSRSGSPRIGS